MEQENKLIDTTESSIEDIRQEGDSIFVHLGQGVVLRVELPPNLPPLPEEELEKIKRDLKKKLQI